MTNELDEFEKIAEIFYKETGFTRSGKDVSPHATENSEARELAWKAWRKGMARGCEAGYMTALSRVIYELENVSRSVFVFEDSESREELIEYLKEKLLGSYSSK